MGRPCTATVLSVADIGVVINRVEVFEFKLHIRLDDGSAVYETTLRDAPNAIEAGGVGIGDTEFRCVADADDRSRVKVFWLDQRAGSAVPTAIHT
jgi:hypothetical protein